MLENKGVFKKIVGKNLRSFRLSKGWTQMDLSEKLGYESSGTVSLIETGEN